MKWSKSDFYCPMCGKRLVAEDDGDDYYYGCNYCCLVCETVFSFQTWRNADKSTLEEIKESYGSTKV